MTKPGGRDSPAGVEQIAEILAFNLFRTAISRLRTVVQTLTIREEGILLKHTIHGACADPVQGLLAVIAFTAKARAAARRARKVRANERAADLAPIIIELQASGVTTLRAFAAALNDRHVPTPNKRGKWRPEQVSRLLHRLDLVRSHAARQAGRPPFGFDAVDGRLIPNDVEQAALARMTELRDHGASFRKISAAIAREFRRTMAPTTIQRILDRVALPTGQR